MLAGQNKPDKNKNGIMPPQAKNLILISILTCIRFAAPMYCQTGINIGVGISDIAYQLNGDKIYMGYEINALKHNMPSFSYYISLSQHFLSQSRFHPVIELQYARKGVNYSTSYLFDDMEYYIRVHYLKVPVLLQFNLRKKNGTNSGFVFGPYVSYRMLAIRLLTVQGVTDRKKVDNVKPFDLGLLAGYSHDFNLANLPLSTSGTISYSLVNMMTPIDGVIMRYDGPEKEYARNITIMLSIGYRIK
jgi:hypothetical protein